jgi:hypothetical protein
MAFSPQFEPDEVLVHDVRVKFVPETLLGSSLRIQLTNRSAWWAATNVLGVVDTLRTVKAPIASIQSISFGHKRRLLAPALGLCSCILLALIGLFWGLRQMIGLRRNRAIKLVSAQETLYWVEPSTSDAPLEAVGAAIDTLRNWAKEHGIQVTG